MPDPCPLSSEAAIAALTPRQRRALGLIARDGLNSGDELAAALDIEIAPAQSVYTALRKAGLIAYRAGTGGRGIKREVAVTCPPDLALALVPPKPPAVAPAAKTRACLTCRAAFESAWAGERVCGRCKTTAAWRSGDQMPGIRYQGSTKNAGAI